MIAVILLQKNCCHTLSEKIDGMKDDVSQDSNDCSQFQKVCIQDKENVGQVAPNELQSKLGLLKQLNTIATAIASPDYVLHSTVTDMVKALHANVTENQASNASQFLSQQKSYPKKVQVLHPHRAAIMKNIKRKHDIKEMATFNESDHLSLYKKEPTKLINVTILASRKNPTVCQ